MKKLGAKVVGISGDSVVGLGAFKQVNDLNFPMISDSDGKIAKQFGVPLRDGGSLERTIAEQVMTFIRGVTASRWTFIIGKDGKIIHKDVKARARQDSKNTLAVLKGMTPAEGE